MAETTLEVKSYPEMWRSLGVDVERFEKMRCVLGDVYQKNFMFQENRPQAMEYFDWIISEIHGGRIAELLEAKISSMCTVFAESEVISMKNHGEPPADIVGALGTALSVSV